MNQTRRIGVRLEAGLALLPRCDAIADIGCDHGKLAVYLLEIGQVKKVIASDISAPSLEKARQLARLKGLEERIDLRLGDGFDVLHPGEVEVAILAGVGGELIASLLSKQAAIARKMRALLLQPMQNANVLRRFLRENDWCIDEEALCQEGGRLFEWMRVTPGPQEPETDISSEWIDILGPRLWARKEPLLREKILRLRLLLISQIADLEKGGTENSAAIAAEKRRLLQEADEFLERAF